MPDRGVGVTDTAAAAGVAEVRARERTIGAATYAEQYVIPISERVASFKGWASTFRTPGNGAATQNLFSIGNTTGSGVLVALRRLSVQADNAAVLNTSWSNQFKTSRGNTISGGALLSKVPFDSAQTSAANVELRGAASADGTAAALTGTHGAIGWHQFANRIHTAAGQMLLEDEPLIPALCADDPIILRPNEFIFCSVLANATTANGTSVMYLINCMWEEFTLP